jgi:GDPmannose 4,6-dehydratase
MPSALITGVNGQDGTYLADLLLSKGYRVIGAIANRSAAGDRTVHDHGTIDIVATNLLDQTMVEDMVRQCKPDEIYNLAARASSNELWLQPVLTGEVNALAVACLLEAICKIDRKIRFIQASSSEVFGIATEEPQSEETPFHPRNPYGVAKMFGHWTTVIYREQRGVFACSAILYNHESPRRGLEFVTRKISHAVAMIRMGLSRELRLGDLDARRDWGFAGDYVQAMWLALQHPTPDDYIIATGETHSVRELCEIAFSHVGLKYQEYVTEDPQNLRVPEPVLLVGNPAKARRLLGWSPTMTFEELVRMMVEADLESIQHVRESSDPLADEAVGSV